MSEKLSGPFEAILRVLYKENERLRAQVEFLLNSKERDEARIKRLRELRSLQEEEIYQRGMKELALVKERDALRKEIVQHIGDKQQLRTLKEAETERIEQDTIRMLRAEDENSEEKNDDC